MHGSVLGPQAYHDLPHPRAGNIRIGEGGEYIPSVTQATAALQLLGIQTRTTVSVWDCCSMSWMVRGSCMVLYVALNISLIVGLPKVFRHAQ